MLVKINKENLKKIREKKGFSQRKLALLAGLPGNAVYRMEEAEYRVSSYRVEPVAKVLGTAITNIIVCQEVS